MSKKHHLPIAKVKDMVLDDKGPWSSTLRDRAGQFAAVAQMTGRLFAEPILCQLFWLTALKDPGHRSDNWPLESSSYGRK